MRRILIVFASCICAATSFVRADAPRLNVLLLLSDDQRYEAFRPAGNDKVITPNLDKLASRSVYFGRTFVTVPICTPSRAALLTGCLEAKNGVSFFGKKESPEVAPWPRVMAKAGYQTAFTGKWHNVQGPDYYGFEWTANMFIAGMGDYINPKLRQKVGDKAEVVPGVITDLFTDAAVRFLKERDKSRPFFLYVPYTTPHDPRTPLPEHEKRYQPAELSLPTNFMVRPAFDPGTLDIRDEKLLARPLDPDHMKVETARYYALITHMDEQIGRIFKELHEQGLEENTIIIFGSDNGLTLGSHGLLGKQTLHEEGVRVPLMMRHPKIERNGQKRDALVYLADLMPTVCEWTGVPLPGEIDGKSLASVYEGKEKGVRDAVFGRYDERDDPRFRSIRTDQYRLIRYLKLKKEELFDLTKDPYELHDLSGEASLRGVRKELRRKLRAFVKSQNDEVALQNWKW